MPGSGIDGHDVAPKASRRSRVEHHDAVGVGARHELVDVGDGRETLARPGDGREGRSSRGHVTGFPSIAVLLDPGRQSAVEKRGLPTKHAQHHDESTGRHSTGVVVGDDPGVVTDSESSHRIGERFGGRERMSSVGR